MQGVSVAPALNDENTGIGMGPAAVFKENAGMQSSKQGSALKSTRKAFGNITNTQLRESAQPGTVKRRAFGADITNSALKPTTAKKQDALQQKPVHVPAAEAVPPSQPWWATAQPEKSAGKTWEQLQADREREEDKDVERSVQLLLAGMRDITSRIFQVYVADSDDDEPLKPPPPQCSLPEWPQPMHSVPAEGTHHNSSGAPLLSILNDDTPLEDLLPDIPLPEDEPAWLGTAAGAGDALAVGEQPVSNAEQHSTSANAPSTSPSAAASNCSNDSPSSAAAAAGRAWSSPHHRLGLRQYSQGLKSPDAMPW